MGLHVGNMPVKQVYVGSTPVTAVYVGAQKVWPMSEVHEVSLTGVTGSGTVHPLLTATVPAGETWSVRIQGTMTKAASNSSNQPRVRIGGAIFGPYAQGETLDVSGTVTSADTTIAIVTQGKSSTTSASFVGTVTIEKPEKIWPDKEVVQITLGTGLQARDQLRSALADRGLNYQTVAEIPFDIELVGSGSTEEMFHSCSSLRSVPAMDTSNVTSMLNMFHSCSALRSVPAMDTSSVTNMGGLFQYCSSLTSVPDLATAQVTSAHYMFFNCPSLTDGNVRLIGRHPSVTTSQMITGSGLTRLPFYDTAGNPI